MKSNASNVCVCVCVCVWRTELDRRNAFWSNMLCEEGSPHLIRRDYIYEDVLKLYEDIDDIVNEHPFRIAFDDEEAIDSGGVSRDMFSGFWVTALQKFFDGSGSVVPATHPNVDLAALPVIGTILSHGYIACGFLPVHMSFPVMVSILKGPTVQIEESVICESFINFLCYHDASVLKEAFLQLGQKKFSQKVESGVLSLLSGFDCRQVPSPSNLKYIIANIARNEFLVKPLGAICAMNKGIPVEHRSFWQDFDIQSFLKVYLRSSATAANVLKVIKEPPFDDSAQAVVFGYLTKYVGNMKDNELRNFLRFVTGSSALVVKDIFVTFNGLSGLSRRPIPHTCTSTLELPTSYETYLEFSREFDAILASELSWVMNAI